MNDAEPTMDTDHLTDRQRRYVQHVAAGMDSRAAAKAAGYRPSYGRVIRTRFKQNHIVARLVSEIRAEARKQSSYDLATAMAEAEAVCAFAQKHKNAMAFCKAVELRSRLSGLLVDKIEVVNADLRGALERAEKRIIQILPVVTNGTAVNLTPQIAGDPVTEDQEETPVDARVTPQGIK